MRAAIETLCEKTWSKLPHFPQNLGGNFEQKLPTIFRVLKFVFRTYSTHAAKLPYIYYLQAKNQKISTCGRRDQGIISISTFFHVVESFEYTFGKKVYEEQIPELWYKLYTKM